MRTVQPLFFRTDECARQMPTESSLGGISNDKKPEVAGPWTSSHFSRPCLACYIIRGVNARLRIKKSRLSDTYFSYCPLERGRSGSNPFFCLESRSQSYPPSTVGLSMLTPSCVRRGYTESDPIPPSRSRTSVVPALYRRRTAPSAR